jgi:hypothetical protein
MLVETPPAESQRHLHVVSAKDETPIHPERPRCEPRDRRDFSGSIADLVCRRHGRGGHRSLSHQGHRDGPRRGEPHDRLCRWSGGRHHQGIRRTETQRRPAIGRKAKAKDYVRSFSYRDQFFGKPIRDEQGTRDRPFDLTVEFEKKIDDILRAFSLKLASHRPRLAVFVEMDQGSKNYIVTTDGPQSQ